MKVVFSEEQLRHEPENYFVCGRLAPHPEQPERARRLLTAARASGLTLAEPPPTTLDDIGRLHSDRYLTFLENVFARWAHVEDAASEVVPGIHPTDYADLADASYPASSSGQAGRHQIDLSSPIGRHTFSSALWSARAAAHAAERVLGNEAACYALARPPGHHAGREFAAGFCYLGNSALAAQVLRRGHEKVAVLDIDVHHGNGTQDIFYERADILTVSIHADPQRFYPFHWGYAHETGRGAGAGCNLNLPLPRGTTDAEYEPALDTALDAIQRFSATALVVALGLDAHESDPFQGFAITTPGFARIARRIASLGLPTVLVQEGGYLSDPLGDNLSAVLEGFAAGSLA